MKYVDFVFTAESLKFIGDDGSERVVKDKDSIEAQQLFAEVTANREALTNPVPAVQPEAPASEPTSTNDDDHAEES